MSESVSTLGSGTTATGRPKCLIACSGSVATLKIPELVADLSLHFDVMIICTNSAGFFLERSSLYNEEAWRRFELVGGWNLVLKDEDEWQMWNTIGNSVLHIEMRRWADVLIVAPASANVIAKAAYGISDNFVLSVIRAWDFSKPCALCPAMNTVMWTHPTTKESLDRLQSWGWEILGPVEKMLACNDRGMGAMVSLNDIKAFLVSKFFQRTQGASDTPHALTNSNLQLHSLLLNASGSPNTTIDSTMSKSKDAAADKQINKAGAKDNTPHAEDANFKQKLTAMHATSSKVAHATATPVSTAAVVTTAEGTVAQPSPADATKKLVSEPTKAAPDSPGSTDKSTDKAADKAVTKRGAKTFAHFALQSLMLGVGLGVGIMVSSALIGALVGVRTSGDLFSIRPGTGKEASI